MQPLRETSRLLLRIEHEAIAEHVLEFYENNRQIFELYEPTRPSNFYTLAYHKTLLTVEYQEMLRGRTLRYYVYTKENPNHIIGSVNFSNIMHGPFSRASIGYKFDKSVWGNGYAYESCVDCIQLLFKDYDIHRIEAKVLPTNYASIRLLEHLSFVPEGTEYQSVEIQGHWQDHYRYSLLNTSYQ